jgi:GNAT superfamily N-acetyltransferase
MYFNQYKLDYITVQGTVVRLTMKYYISPLTAEHTKSANDIFHSAFDITYPLHRLWRHRNHDLSCGIFTREGDLLGFALVIDNYVQYLAVHDAFQGLGIGTVLLKKILEICIDKNISIYLSPLDDVVGWYCKHGFYGTKDGELVFHTHNTRRQGLFLRRYSGGAMTSLK